VVKDAKQIRQNKPLFIPQQHVRKQLRFSKSPPVEKSTHPTRRAHAVAAHARFILCLLDVM
jgi:hypothetical protein